MTTYRLDLSYDGSGFHGYARQRDVRTVQGELETALEKLAGPVETVVAGRTDAGVHATHQVVSFVADQDLDTERVVRSLNGMLPDEIAVLACQVVPDTFHARFSAAFRRYEYRILNRPVRDPRRRATHWHVPAELDREAMHAAAQLLVGRHDFASFCRKAPDRSTERTVLSAGWSEPCPDVLLFEITGLAFCHQMVRSIVGTCVAVGRGTIPTEEVARILEARDRNAGPGGAAPAHGLTLVEVGYDAG